MNYRACYQEGVEVLKQAEVPESEYDARILLEEVCGTDRSDLLAHGDREVSAENRERYRELLEKRRKRIPLQQILGRQEFMGLSFFVNDQVLIPRQDTEILVEEVLRDLHDGMSVLDLCTGSGCILLSLLHYSNACRGLGTDLSKEALFVAEKNAAALLGERPDTDCRFLQSDLFEKVEGKFDRIVSNPPYIPSRVIEELMPEVRDYEPHLALDGKEDGLYFYREIVSRCPQYLYQGGKLYLEIGYDQGAAVSGLLKEHGFQNVEVVIDYAGNDRVVSGEL